MSTSTGTSSTPRRALTSRREANAFVSFSVANREPNRDNFTEAGRDERPQHETLYDYEAGYGFGNSRFHVGANLYFMDYSNQLILTGKISEIGEASLPISKTATGWE